MSGPGLKSVSLFPIAQAPQDVPFVQNPYEFYANRHAANSTFFWTDFGHWCFSGWEDVNRLFRDKRFGRQILHVASREELGWPDPLAHTPHFDAAEAHSLLSIEPPDHTRIRTLVNRAFVSRQIEQMRPKVETLANELLDKLDFSQPVDLIEEYAVPIPVFIIAEMLGVPKNMARQLVDWSHQMVAMYMFGRTRMDELKANEAAREFSDYLRELIAEKRKAPAHDLISHMIETESKGQHLSEDELVSTIILLLNAGHEATVHQTGNAIKAILESDHDLNKMFSTAEQTAATVEECLRYTAPLHMFTRYVLEPIDLPGGLHLNKGDEIGLMLAAANRDPHKFDDPDRFDPYRQDNANVSFGAGIHFCIGAPLARLEMQVALRVLFSRLPQLKLAEVPVFKPVYHFHGLERLMVTA